MTPLFSRIGRNLSMVKQPFMVFRLSLTPDEAVARCVTHWRTFKIQSETPGMREQFALAGWVGTELVIGNNGKAFLADAIATSSATATVAELFPKAIPDRVRRAFVEKTFVEIIARPLPGSGGRMCELCAASITRQQTKHSSKRTFSHRCWGSSSNRSSRIRSCWHRWSTCRAANCRRTFR